MRRGAPPVACPAGGPVTARGCPSPMQPSSGARPDCGPRAPLPTEWSRPQPANPNLHESTLSVHAKLTQERHMSSVLNNLRNAGPAAAQGAPVERCPLPIPLGWFFVGYSEELPAGELRSIEYFGQEWILFRNQAGEAGVVDPYCPHLGAHLGHGGKVDGDSLVCPFHNWAYNPKGWCTRIPYAKVLPPVTKRQPILQALPV